MKKYSPEIFQVIAMVCAAGVVVGVALRTQKTTKNPAPIDRCGAPGKGQS